eukprot:SAG31_NODE_534_length_14370_cov_121.217434_15_plen_93_part_00
MLQVHGPPAHTGNPKTAHMLCYFHSNDGSINMPDLPQADPDRVTVVHDSEDHRTNIKTQKADCDIGRGLCSTKTTRVDVSREGRRIALDQSV